MRSIIAAILALALVPVMAQAKDTRSANRQLAYFQTKNIYHFGLRGTHTVALTFDDGPNGNTLAVLDALRAQNIKATFFVVGKMAEAHRDVLREIAVEGHLLGNHSATHPLLGDTYVQHPELLLDQIRAVDDQIAPLMPADAKFYFRAPYGAWRKSHAAVLNADPVLKKYVGPIYWDVGGATTFNDDGYILSSADWQCWGRKWSAETCAKGYLREIRRKDGGVVLMHCVGSKAADLVNAVVPALIEEGYSFVRLDEVPELQKYETPPEESPVMAMNTRGELSGARK
ncbi:MAG TPA: polysaccharide deacetylase family protein [Rhizomicrobium sp.]|jgi:peptidoglycan/xylan/chitin deacetylase (PgdA/CDA1 family)